MACPRCRRWSSRPLTAAPPSSLLESSTGRFEVNKVLDIAKASQAVSRLHYVTTGRMAGDLLEE
jgi:hypothetical protein